MTGAAAVTAADLSGPRAADVLAALHARAPVTWLPAIGGWLVTGHALADSVMRDDDAFTVDDPRFSTAQVVGPSMLSLDGAAHRRHRSPFVLPFRPRQVEQTFAAPVRSLADGLVDGIRADGHADLRTALAGPLSVAVMAEILGLGDVDPATVLRWYSAIVAAVSALSSGAEPDAGAARAVTELADRVRAGLGGTSILSAARASLDESEVIANAAVMMFGGIETTEGMISNALLHVLGDPVTASAVVGDDALLADAVEESLRLEPAAGAVDRYATRDVALGPVTVAAGDLVRVSLTAANRDPTVFPEPDRFDPTRANLRANLSFARGPHVCIAMDLARLETRAAVRAALDLPRVTLDGAPPPVGLIFRKPAAVPVRWDAGAPAAG